MNIEQLAQIAAPVLGQLNGELYFFTSARTPNSPFLVTFSGLKRLFNKDYQVVHRFPQVVWKKGGLRIRPKFDVKHVKTEDAITVVYDSYRGEFRLI